MISYSINCFNSSLYSTKSRLFSNKAISTIEKSIINSDKSVEVTMTLFMNREIEAAILGLGSDVEVLSTYGLNETIATNLTKATEQYL